jgi:hypothetical protein
VGQLNQWLGLPHDQDMKGIIGEDPNPNFNLINLLFCSFFSFTKTVG